MSKRFYTSFFERGGKVYVRQYVDGIYCEDSFPISPTLYIKSPKKNVDITAAHYNIYEEKIYPIEFESPKEARDFVKTYKESGIDVYGYPRFAYTKIDELFPGVIDYDYDLLKIMGLDIETKVDYGFPNVITANEEITLISASYKGKVYTFATKEWNRRDPNVVYVACSTEIEMLKRFMQFYSKLKPDVLTGWNTNGFDIPYVYNRICNLVDEKLANKLSPFGWCKKSINNFDGKEQVYIEISGVQSLDYLELYQKFELSPRENYKLDTIAEIELGERKVEYEGSFKSFYENDWDTFVEYNIQDVRLIDKLESKLKFIMIALSMAMKSKCNMDDVYRVTRIWDNIIANHLRAQKIEVETSFKHFGEPYEGAFVKPTIAGLYKWAASFDVASLYPSTIVQYNISPDTILHRSTFHDITPYDVINQTEKFQLAISDAISKNATLCANGSMYSKEKEGFLPHLVKKYFADRVAAKNEMKKWAKEAERVKLEIERRKAC